MSGAAITAEDEDEAESGGGASLALGWGVNRTVTLFIQGAGASVQMVGASDSYTLAHVDLGVRLNFREPTAMALPYVTLAYSGRASVWDLDGEDLTMAGAGPTLGGGVALFLNRKVAVDLGLRWTTGSFTEVQFRGDTESIDLGATSARVDVGLSWWAGR